MLLLGSRQELRQVPLKSIVVLYKFIYILHICSLLQGSTEGIMCPHKGRLQGGFCGWLPYPSRITFRKREREEAVRGLVQTVGV
jgi:hypothetical protein